MSDKKDKSDADLEANLAKIANTKPRRRNRKDNIYERFITRVESLEETESLESLQADGFNTPANSHTDAYNDNDTDIGGNFEAGLLKSSIQKSPLKPLKNADKLSSYEPLSAAELDLFAIQEQNDLDKTLSLQAFDDSTTSVSLDFSDDQEDSAANFSASESLDDVDYSDGIDDTDKSIDNHEAIEVDTIAGNYKSISSGSSTAEPLAAVTSKKSKKKKGIKSTEQASDKKSLIVGMALGSLIIAGAVLTLIATGVLSTEPNTVKAPVAENVSQPSPANQPAANGSEQNIVVDANTMPAVPSVAGEPNATAKPLTPNPQKTQVTDDEAAVITPKAEPAITYEDFREESQNTLYRETND
ncbi:hypothetical protein [Psychrobacter glacincola]|uniref:hypothetical protein n=1 Tax=Psychrobacter glacincola TaxID=56810 RepID=UPI0039B0D7FF